MILGMSWRSSARLMAFFRCCIEHVPLEICIESSIKCPTLQAREKEVKLAAEREAKEQEAARRNTQAAQRADQVKETRGQTVDERAAQEPDAKLAAPKFAMEMILAIPSHDLGNDLWMKILGYLGTTLAAHPTTALHLGIVLRLMSVCRKYHAIANNWLQCLPHAIDMSSTKLGNLEAAVQAVARHCPKMQRLNLSGCGYITDEAVQAVKQYCFLQISLDTDAPPQTVLQHYLQMQYGLQMQQLILSTWRNITDVAVQAVAQQCPKMQWLDLSQCGNITEAAVLAVAQQCPEMQNAIIQYDAYVPVGARARQ